MPRRTCRIALSLVALAGIFAPPAAAQSRVEMFVDVPAPNATVPVPFVVAGWALDTAAPTGSGVDAVHVWAFPYIGSALGTPVFLGGATLGVSRPDVGLVFGPNFATAGFQLVVPQSLPAGAYTLRALRIRPRPNSLSRPSMFRSLL
jgi:hypothetical protein